MYSPSVISHSVLVSDNMLALLLMNSKESVNFLHTNILAYEYCELLDILELF